MTDRDRVLRTIRALLEKTVANGCPVEEAMAAHAKAQALIDKYQVSHEELYGTGPGPRSRNPEPEPEAEPEPAEPKQQQQPSPKKSAGIGALFTPKTAIAVGIVLIVALLWGKSVITGVSGPFKSWQVVEAPKEAARRGEPPIIKADNSPTKITPAPADLAGKAPDRMPSGDGTERFVPREETPVDVSSKAAGPRVDFPPLNQPHRIKTFSVHGDQPDAATAPVAATPAQLPGLATAVPQTPTAAEPVKTDNHSPPAMRSELPRQPPGYGTDHVGQPSSTEQPVAQRVVLYDEDPSDPKGRQYVGSVVWRTEPTKWGVVGKGDIAVRADIDIPDRKFKMTMSFRRNTNSSLPASHTAELTFILPPDFSGGGVTNVPGILMKSNDQARGTPLAGLAVKVTDGFFLVGLSNVDADRSRNVQLLKERSWFDVPLVYYNQRRANLAIEKGAPGERAFKDALTAWGEDYSPQQSAPQTATAPLIAPKIPDRVGQLSSPAAPILPPALAPRQVPTPTPVALPAQQTPSVAHIKRIKLKYEHGVYTVPVLINGKLTLDFIVDTGASAVTLSGDVALTLQRSGTIDDADWGGDINYKMADGHTGKAMQLRLHSLQIGEGDNAVIAPGIIGSVDLSPKGSLLLGQTFLRQFKSTSIDHSTSELVIDDTPNPNPPKQVMLAPPAPAPATPAPAAPYQPPAPASQPAYQPVPDPSSAQIAPSRR